MSWLYQKTTWAGLGLIGLGVYQITSGEIQTGIESITGGFAMIFLRQAISKNGLGK